MSDECRPARATARARAIRKLMAKDSARAQGRSGDFDARAKPLVAFYENVENPLFTNGFLDNSQERARK
eukprot:836703-Pyramimonas_sp.AAC.1